MEISNQNANSAASFPPQLANPRRPPPVAAKAGENAFRWRSRGGGSFGAFTWGVLDRLLEENDLTFDAISGASAGAINAVVMAAGLADGGRPEARARLERFWTRVRSRAAGELKHRC